MELNTFGTRPSAKSYFIKINGAHFCSPVLESCTITASD